MRALLRLLSPILFLVLPLSSAFAASAYVHDLKGTLTSSAGAGPARPLKMGDTFDAGVTLATGKDSIAVVKFEDGQVVTLSSDTRFAVREYSYNKKSVKDSNMVFALLQGGLRFVTGVIGATNKNKFKLAVGTATIGVRGTDGWASYVEGVILAAVNQGALAFTTPQGTQAIPAGSTAITGTGIALVQVAPTTQLIATLRAQGATDPRALAGANLVQSQAVVQSQINNVTIPINTPVVVAAAAQAAQVVATARVAQALAVAAANNLAAAKTDAEKAAAATAKAAADAAAAKATALATAAINTAQQAAVQALNAAVSAGASLPVAPPPTPAATPLTAVVPALTTAQVQQQAATVEASVTTQTINLQTTQGSLGLPVTSTTEIQNAAPAGTTELAPPATPIPIYIPPATPVSPS